MKTQENVVFLFDVDNTRLENDRLVTDLGHHLAQKFGDESRNRYWQIFEAARHDLGYADYLGALQRYRVETMNDPRLLMMSSFLVDYPFAARLYLGALDVLDQRSDRIHAELGVVRGPTSQLSRLGSVSIFASAACYRSWREAGVASVCE